MTHYLLCCREGMILKCKDLDNALRYGRIVSCGWQWSQLQGSIVTCRDILCTASYGETVGVHETTAKLAMSSL